MASKRVGAREAARRTRDLVSWPIALFAERYVLEPNRQHPKDSILLNLSDPEAMAVAVRQLLTHMGVTGVLVTPVPDRTFEWDEDGEEHSYDSRRDEPWWREKAMAEHLSPARYEAVSKLFREAGVKRGFSAESSVAGKTVRA